MPSPLDSATKDALLLIALFVSTALGGVLAYVHHVPYGDVAGVVAVAAATIMLTAIFLRDPYLLPIAILGIGLVAAAGVSTARERARR